MVKFTRGTKVTATRNGATVKGIVDYVYFEQDKIDINLDDTDATLTDVKLSEWDVKKAVEPLPTKHYAVVKPSGKVAFIKEPFGDKWRSSNNSASYSEVELQRIIGGLEFEVLYAGREER